MTVIPAALRHMVASVSPGMALGAVAAHDDPYALTPRGASMKHLIAPTHIRSSSLAIALLTALTLACSDTVGPGTDGPLVFAARVDGSPWTVENSAATEAFFTAEGDFVLRVIRRDSLFRAVDGMALIIQSLAGPGRYPLTSDFDRDYGLYAIYDPVNGGSTSFISTPPNAGQVEVTAIDTAARRIAGRFYFEAQELEGSRRVTIGPSAFRVSYEIALP